MMEKLFIKLASIIKSHSEGLAIAIDQPDYLYVNTGKKDAKNKDIFFAMVKQGKDKVSFHLMPIYCNPNLLANISPELKKKMQGKSCFNFKLEEENLIAELSELTLASINDYRAEGKV